MALRDEENQLAVFTLQNFFPITADSITYCQSFMVVFETSLPLRGLSFILTFMIYEFT